EAPELFPACIARAVCKLIRDREDQSDVNSQVTRNLRGRTVLPQLPNNFFTKFNVQCFYSKPLRRSFAEGVWSREYYASTVSRLIVQSASKSGLWVTMMICDRYWRRFCNVP